LFYVATWEVVVYSKLAPDFMEKYAAYSIEKLKASGATAAAIEAKRQELEQFKVMYDKPWFRAPLTFTEPFPVGLLVTLVSAGVLRRSQKIEARS
jgi:hypothetical protein